MPICDITDKAIKEHFQRLGQEIHALYSSVSLNVNEIYVNVDNNSVTIALTTLDVENLRNPKKFLKFVYKLKFGKTLEETLQDLEFLSLAGLGLIAYEPKMNDSLFGFSSATIHRQFMRPTHLSQGVRA